MKKLTITILSILMVFTLCSCGGKRTTREEETTLVPEKTVAIEAGDYKVYLDEAKYYAYTAQGTYETYYISKGKDIDWSSKMSGNTTWTEGVKSMVIDDICRRESMYARAKEFNISLTDEEKSAIKQQVTNYFNESSKKLISKIGIGEKRLQYVFEKDAIAKKVEDIMIANNKTMADDEYSKWKEKNTIIADKQWGELNFKEHLFLLSDTDLATSN